MRGKWAGREGRTIWRQRMREWGKGVGKWMKGRRRWPSWEEGGVASVTNPSGKKEKRLNYRRVGTGPL